MADNRLSENLRRSILVYSILSGFILATVVAGVSIMPLYSTLREQREDKLLSVLHARTAAVEIFLTETRELAQLMASRTSIRSDLEALTRDPSRTNDLAASIRNSLADAIGSAPLVSSAYCFGPDDKVIAHAGLALPRSIATWVKERHNENESLRAIRSRGAYQLLYRISIHNREDSLLGVLVIQCNFDHLRQRLARLPDIGVHEDTYLGTIEEGKVQILLEMRGRERERTHGKPSPRLTEVLRRTTDDRTGLLEEDASLREAEIFAYRPVAGTDWGLAIRQSQRTLLADIDEQLYRLGGIVFLLIFVISVGMFLLLRPLAGKMVMHSRELEDQIDLQTEDLEAERQRLLAITNELQEQKKRLESANEDLDAFSRTVAHDLRNPLVAIQGFTDLLQDVDTIKQDEEAMHMLSRIAYKSRLMGDQITALLHYARAGKAELHPRTVDLSQMADEVATDLRAQTGRDVEMKIQPGMTIYADPTLLHNIMENLLGNAWKYTAHVNNPVVQIGTEKRDGETVYSIQDNGAGFDMMFAERLFVPFQRLHSDSDFAGTGIGLSTVKRIIEQHGGRIWAEGKLGAGATFFFTMPSEPDSETTDPA